MLDRLLVRFDRIVGFIVNANHSVMRAAVKLRVTHCIFAGRTTNDRNIHKQPRQLVATDFLNERQGDVQLPQTLAITIKTKVPKGWSGRSRLRRAVARRTVIHGFDHTRRLPLLAKMRRACCSCSSSIPLLLVNESYS
jgi:hypothetical protein